MTTWLDGTSGNRAASLALMLDKPPGSGAALPVLPDANYPAGALFCRTTDFTLWRSTAAVWNQITANVSAGAITNNEVSAAAAIAESKLSIAEKIGEPYCTDRGLIISGNAVVANHIRGMRYRWPKSGTVLALSVFCVTAGGNAVLGIYDLSATNLNLLATGPQQASGATATWHDATMTTPLVVVGGTDAYLVIHSDNVAAFWGRTAALNSNVSQGPLPAGYMSGADGLSLRSWDYNRTTFSAPLPNTIPTASCTASPPIVIYVKYA